MVEIGDGIILPEGAEAVFGDLSKVVRVIGRGAEREVYEVEGSFGKGALKFIRRSRKHTPDAAVRRELSALFSLTRVGEEETQSPNVARILQVNNIAEPYYVVEELIEGVSLKEFLLGRIVSSEDETSSKTDEDIELEKQRLIRINEFDPRLLSLEEIVNIGVQTANGLRFLHNKERNIVHSDLHPGNIMIRSEGVIKITDYGQSSSKGEFTLGTLLYTAPEKARAVLDGRELESNHLQDIYSLGVLLYHFTQGKLPFTVENKDWSKLKKEEKDAERRKLLQKIIDGNLIFERQIPKRLERIIRKCLAHNPNDRYSSADQVYRELKKFRDRKKRRIISVAASVGLIGISSLMYHFVQEYLASRPFPKAVLAFENPDQNLNTDTLNDYNFSSGELFLWSVGTDENGKKIPLKMLQQVTFSNDEFEESPAWLRDKIVYTRKYQMVDKREISGYRQGMGLFLLRPDGKCQTLGASYNADDLSFAISTKGTAAYVCSLVMAEGENPTVTLVEIIVDGDGKAHSSSFLDTGVDVGPISYGRHINNDTIYEHHNILIFYAKSGKIWGVCGWENPPTPRYSVLSIVDSIEGTLFQITDGTDDRCPYVDENNHLYFLRETGTEAGVYVLKGPGKPQKTELTPEDLERMRVLDRIFSRDPVPVYKPFADHFIPK